MKLASTLRRCCSRRRPRFRRLKARKRQNSLEARAPQRRCRP